MKISFIIPFKRLSGGIKVIFLYADNLKARGHDVKIYMPMVSYKGLGQNALFRIKASLSNTFKREHWYDENRIKVIAVPKINNTWIEDGDVVVASSWQTAYDVANLSHTKGEKYYFVQDYEIFNGSREEVEGTYSLGLSMITINEALYKMLSLYSDDVNIIYNGLFKDEFLNEEKKHNKGLRLLFMYHESPHKGSDDALKVIDTVQTMIPNVEIYVFGRVIPNNISSRFHAYQSPDRNSLLQLYRDSDIYLFTSKVEAWGLPVVEAMANKCAVVGRNVGSVAELYNGSNMVVANTIGDMVNAIVELNDDRKRLLNIQQNGYHTALSLDWSNSFDKFERIIQPGEY